MITKSNKNAINTYKSAIRMTMDHASRDVFLHKPYVAVYALAARYKNCHARYTLSGLTKPERLSRSFA